MERIFYGSLASSERQNLLSDLERKKNVIRRCHFCLIQSGADMDSLGALIQLAHRYSVKVIVKVNALGDLASLREMGADILVSAVEEASSSGSGSSHKADVSGAALEVAVGRSACSWRYRDRVHKCQWEGVFTDMDTVTDVFCAVLACYLPVKDGTEEMVGAAVTKAFDYLTRRVRS